MIKNLKKFNLILLNLNLSGHVILQAIIDENEHIHLIECSTRFGGASTLAIRAGLDSFYWAYLESCNTSLNDYPFCPSQSKIKQIRYPKDCYTCEE